MAEITYTHHQTGEDGTIVWHGQRFYPNRPVETDNAELIGAATGHPHFEVSTDEASDGKFGEFAVVRQGRNRFVVVRGDEVLSEPLPRAEAESLATELAAGNA